MTQKINQSVEITDDSQNNVEEVVKNVVDEWKDSNPKLKVKELAGGITNKLFSCSDENKFTVLVRVYGNGTENLIDRDEEIKSIERLSDNGFAPKLHGRFENGFVYGFYEGKVLKPEDLSEGTYNVRIARMMGRWHKQEVKGMDKTPCIWEKMNSWIDLIPDSYKDDKKTATLKKNFSKSKLRSEVNFLQSYLSNFNSPIVFCHNDLLSGNIIYDERQDEIHFIDYEYGAYNYRAFDIANHFIEWGGFDLKQFPSKERQFEFYREYLSIVNGTQPTEEQIHELFVEVSRFVLASHLLWTLWGLVQESLSQIDFDYLDYAVRRMELYQKRKDQLLVPQAQ